jgi:hypothetical protein
MIKGYYLKDGVTSKVELYTEKEKTQQKWEELMALIKDARSKIK